MHLSGLHLVICSPCEAMWSPQERSGLHVESTRQIWSPCEVHQKYLEFMWSPPGISRVLKLALTCSKKNMLQARFKLQTSRYTETIGTLTIKLFSHRYISQLKLQDTHKG